MADKLQLVFCSHDYGRLAYEDEIQAQPPLGLLCLASYLKHANSNLEIEVLDGKLLSEREILDRLDADLIGLSVWFSNYRATITLADKIKSVNPDTRIVLGGPHTAYLAEKILMNRKSVDYVIPKEGEVPLTHLVLGNSVEDVPGVWFRLYVFRQSGQV
jgi:radical SAM superfamily enzyme YgiQ (UPF0313 family)